MYGDWQSGSGYGGSDTFVFADAFGTDYIHDFHQAEGDLIEFQVAGADYNALNIDYSSGDAVITSSKFGSGDSVTVVGYDGSDAADTLTADDFLFT